MEKKFHCEQCNTIFEAKAVAKEYSNPLYGPCVSYIATCPKCKKECKEYIAPKQSKATSAAAPCGSSSCACPYS